MAALCQPALRQSASALTAPLRRRRLRENNVFPRLNEGGVVREHMAGNFDPAASMRMQRDFALAQSCSQVQYGSAFQASSPKTKAGFAGLFLSAYQGSNLFARYRSGNTRSARLPCVRFMGETRVSIQRRRRCASAKACQDREVDPRPAEQLSVSLRLICSSQARSSPFDSSRSNAKHSIAAGLSFSAACSAWKLVRPPDSATTASPSISALSTSGWAAPAIGPTNRSDQSAPDWVWIRPSPPPPGTASWTGWKGGRLPWAGCLLAAEW